MAEEKTNELLNKIEKLILDGNKEVLEKVANVETNLGQRIDGVETNLTGVETNLTNEIGWVKQELKRIDKKHDTTTTAMYDLMLDVKKNVAEVKEKLEVHLRIPHMA